MDVKTQFTQGANLKILWELTTANMRMDSTKSETMQKFFNSYIQNFVQMLNTQPPQVLLAMTILELNKLFLTNIMKSVKMLEKTEIDRPAPPSELEELLRARKAEIILVPTQGDLMQSNPIKQNEHEFDTRQYHPYTQPLRSNNQATHPQARDSIEQKFIKITINEEICDVDLPIIPIVTNSYDCDENPKDEKSLMLSPKGMLFEDDENNLILSPKEDACHRNGGNNYFAGDMREVTWGKDTYIPPTSMSDSESSDYSQREMNGALPNAELLRYEEIRNELKEMHKKIDMLITFFKSEKFKTE